MAEAIRQNRLESASAKYLKDNLPLVDWCVAERAGRVVVISWSNPLIESGTWNHYLDINEPDKQHIRTVAELSTVVLHVAEKLVRAVCNYDGVQSDFMNARKMLVTEYGAE